MKNNLGVDQFCYVQAQFIGVFGYVEEVYNFFYGVLS